MIWKFLMALPVTAAISGCATHPDNIEAAYVSPTLYAQWSCPELTEERARLVHRVQQITGQQRSAANTDTVLTTVGIFIFPPLLLGLTATGDHEQELARLRGEYEAVEQAMTRNRCSLTPPGGDTQSPVTAGEPAPQTTGTSGPNATEANAIRREYDSRIRALQNNCTLEGGCQAAIDAVTAERDRRLAELVR